MSKTLNKPVTVHEGGKTFVTICDKICNSRDDSELFFDEETQKHILSCSSCGYVWAVLDEEDLKYL